MQPIDFGLWSLVPPLVAIFLAFMTREVIVSLSFGILSGGIIYGIRTGGTLVTGMDAILKTMGDHLSSNVYMVIFLLLLGALVSVITAAGGALAYGDWAHRKLKSRRSVSFMTALIGCIIFIDDYFNCLTVGTVMRPVTDKFKISREKLAYLIDATSAPVCILAPISSWAAYVVSCIPNNVTEHGMALFLGSMKYNFYAIGALILIAAVCLFDKDFGPMKIAERTTMRGHDVGADHKNAPIGLAAVPVVARGSVFDLILPIIALIIFSVLAMIRDGGFAECDSGKCLSLASFGAILFSFILFVPRKLINFKDFSSVIVVGMKTMMPAVVMLTLAWTISGVCEDLLHTGKFISECIKASAFPLWILPALLFVLAAFMSFATGASWGAIGIVVPVAMQVEGSALLLGAVLAGAVMGDHCSPIADTTILASTGAGCKHHNHVVTQLPYALLVGAISIVLYIIAGLLV